MSIITISLTSLGPYFISGIPRQVVLETNTPSIMYYTLDGDEPDSSSAIYILPIDLPTEGSNTVRLRVLAISGSDSGVLDVSFYPDITKARDNIGIIVDEYGVTPVLYDGYTVDINENVIIPARYSDYELQDLDIVYSSTGVDGYGPGTLIRLGPYPPEFWQDNAVDMTASSPNDQNVYFKPRSLYIVIDSRDGYSDESVYPLNRTWGGTLNDVKYLQGKNFFYPSPIISGGFIKQFINRATGTTVFYYFDNIECRWIKAIHTTDTDTLPRGIAQRRPIGPFIVVPWIYNKQNSI